jgi:hypothetical protein
MTYAAVDGNDTRTVRSDALVDAYFKAFAGTDEGDAVGTSTLVAGVVAAVVETVVATGNGACDEGLKVDCAPTSGADVRSSSNIQQHTACIIIIISAAGCCLIDDCLLVQYMSMYKLFVCVCVVFFF